VVVVVTWQFSPSGGRIRGRSKAVRIEDIDLLGALELT
jgi:hypothetical protein